MDSSLVDRCEPEARTPPPTVLNRAVRLLTDDARGGPSRPRPEDVLEAVAALRQAPAARDWEDALLQGLKSANVEVVERVCNTWLHRLDAFADDPEAQDNLIDAALTACYYVLTGRADTASATDLLAGMREAAAAQIIRGLTAWLKARPDRFDHHRARLLSWGNDRLKYLGGIGDFASAVVEFLVALGTGDQGHHAAARMLARERRRDAYEDSSTSQATLLGYLREDAELPPAEVYGALINSYAVLVSVHHASHSRQALLMALANLTGWLEALPYRRDGEAWDALFSEVIERARVRHPWDQLSPETAFHLHAQRFLLPGKGHPQDLIELARVRYSAPETSDILVAILGVLRRLPTARFRIDELRMLMLDASGMSRRWETWEAFFALVHSLLTGIPEHDGTAAELTGPRRDRLQKLRRVARDDKKIRDWLYTLATDLDRSLSSDPAIDQRVRETAWRMLLRNLPPDRMELVRKGLLGFQDRFQAATLEEMAAFHQRAAWEMFEAHHDRVIHQGLGKVEEHRRKVLALKLFRSTRCRTAVMNKGSGEYGRVLYWAFDDGNPKLRELARSAMVEAGYEEEYNREAQKRTLASITAAIHEVVQRQATVNEAIRKLENQIRQSWADWYVVTQAQHAILGALDVATTLAKLREARLEVDLYEVRQELVAAMQQLRIEEGELRQLRGQLDQECQRARARLAEMNALVGEQRRLESAVSKTTKKYEKAIEGTEQAAHEADRARHELRQAQNRPPREPRYSRDPDARNLELRAYHAERERWNERLRALEHRITSSQAEAQRLKDLARQCRVEIDQYKVRLQDLQREVAELTQRIGAIQSRIGRLRQEYNLQHEQCEQLRRVIAGLTDRVNRLVAQRDVQLEADREQVARLQAEMRSRQEELARHSDRIQRGEVTRARAADELNRLEIRLRELNQSYQSGMQNLAEVGRRADQQSGRTDAEAAAREQATEFEVHDDQERFALYAESSLRAVQFQGDVPVAAPRRNPPRRDRQKENE